MSKTRSKVKGAFVSEDCRGSVPGLLSGRQTNLDLAGVLAHELDNRLSSICDFDFVLRPEAGNDWRVR